MISFNSSNYCYEPCFKKLLYYAHNTIPGRHGTVALFATSVKEKIKMNKNYQSATKEKNGFKLWCIISAECRGGDNNQTIAEQRDEVMRQYYNAHQRAEQEIDAYYDYFLELLKKFKIVGLENPQPQKGSRGFFILLTEIDSETYISLVTMTIPLFQDSLHYLKHFSMLAISDQSRSQLMSKQFSIVHGFGKRTLHW